MSNESITSNTKFDEDSEGSSVRSKNEDFAGAARHLLRSLLRSIPHYIGQLSIGSLPQPRPKVRAIAKSAAKISDLFDYHQIFSNAKKVDSEIHPHHHSSTSSHVSGSNSSHRWSFWNHKYNRYRLISFRAGVELLSNTILGSVLFGAYNSSQKYLVNDTSSFWLSAVCGGFGGAAHGFLTYSFIQWSQMIRTSSRFRHFLAAPSLTRPSFIGLIASHVIVHATLFGSYEFVKTYLCPPMHRVVKYVKLYQEDTEEYEIDRVDIEANDTVILKFLSAIAAAGFTAGFLSEVVSHYSSLFEEHIVISSDVTENSQGRMKGKVTRYLRHLKTRWDKIGLPNLKSSLYVSIPSALGFLTYEISKIIVID